MKVRMEKNEESDDDEVRVSSSTPGPQDPFSLMIQDFFRRFHLPPRLGGKVAVRTSFLASSYCSCQPRIVGEETEARGRVQTAQATSRGERRGTSSSSSKARQYVTSLQRSFS